VSISFAWFQNTSPDPGEDRSTSFRSGLLPAFATASDVSTVALPDHPARSSKDPDSSLSYSISLERLSCNILFPKMACNSLLLLAYYFLKKMT
jgi:hypothetical protein